MHRKVLVTLDGSELSESVLPRVGALLSGIDAEFVLLCVVDAGEDSHTPRSSLEVAGDPNVRFGITRHMDFERVSGARTEEHTLETLQAATKGYLEEKARPLRDSGIDVRTDVRFGDHPAETILEYAEDENVDLIAMATHGRTGLGRILLGSVAGRVVEKGARPVLLVRPSEGAG